VELAPKNEVLGWLA